MKQIQPFQNHWLQITSIVVCRLKMVLYRPEPQLPAFREKSDEILSVSAMLNIVDSWTKLEHYADSPFVESFLLMIKFLNMPVGHLL